MNTLLRFNWLGADVDVKRLGWVLVHSRWQFPLVAPLARATVRTMRRRLTALQYGVLVRRIVGFRFQSDAASLVARWPAALLGLVGFGLVFVMSTGLESCRDAHRPGRKGRRVQWPTRSVGRRSRHPARTGRRCHTDRPPARLVEGQADAAPPVAPVQQATPVQRVVREIKTVLIEVPLCDNPPGLDGTPSFCKAQVNLQLIKSRSPTGRNLLHRLWWVGERASVP